METKIINGKKTIIPKHNGWAIAAFLIPLFIVMNPEAEIGGLISRIFFFFGGFIGTCLGIRVGDAIRRFAMPDAIFTNGGLANLLFTKIFWLIGPQLIGALFGAVIGMAPIFYVWGLL